MILSCPAWLSLPPPKLYHHSTSKFNLCFRRPGFGVILPCWWHPSLLAAFTSLHSRKEGKFLTPGTSVFPSTSGTASCQIVWTVSGAS